MNPNLSREFKALGDPSRVRIIKMLEIRELCVCEVRDVLGLSTSTVSKHLSILRDANLVLDAKDGKWVNYRLNDKAEGLLVHGLLDLLKVSFKDDEQVRADRKRIHSVDRDSICGI
jgi:ArsR family transcriptional regulator